MTADTEADHEVRKVRVRLGTERFSSRPPNALNAATRARQIEP